jgi:hypothetical protein
MKLKKAVSITATIVGFFKYSVAVTLVKEDADECKVYVDAHDKFSDELKPFLEHLERHKFYWSLDKNGLIQIYDGQEKQP